MTALLLYETGLLSTAVFDTSTAVFAIWALISESFGPQPPAVKTYIKESSTVEIGINFFNENLIPIAYLVGN